MAGGGGNKKIFQYCTDPSEQEILGCAVIHSITNSGLIAAGQNSSKEGQTVFFTAVNPMN